MGFAGLGGSAQDGRSGVPVLGQGADAGRRVGARSAGEGSFPEIAKRPVPSGAIFCWVTVRVRRDRSGRARRRRMEWDTQGCFTPRAMWLIGSGFRRARLRAAGSRARDRCFTDSAARCVTSGPMLISGWRRSGESQRPTRARHFGWPCDGSAANRLGGRPANRTRRTIRWVQVNGFRWDRICRIGHCPLDDKKWGTMSTDRNRCVRLRHPPAAQWSSACTANRSPSSADAYHSCPPTVPRPDGTITATVKPLRQAVMARTGGAGDPRGVAPEGGYETGRRLDALVRGGAMRPPPASSASSRSRQRAASRPFKASSSGTFGIGTMNRRRAVFTSASTLPLSLPLPGRPKRSRNR